ncbi:hypothetical protein [Brevibacillus formosus]|uniref:hypothetical protein n=1 Tax=Brevibacillus formosus TaxID=54913 RepID=UPI003F1D07A6
MKYIASLAFSMMLLMHPAPSIHANDFQYGPHNSIKIEKIQEKADFKVLSPNQLPREWNLEIKPYPSEESKKYDSFRFHYSLVNCARLPWETPTR